MERRELLNYQHIITLSVDYLAGDRGASYIESRGSEYENAIAPTPYVCPGFGDFRYKVI
uniref:Uncharacterized protein n=1 Tax=Candidatus Methanogaster sp. ANME-2c ERB4 TaxID=2759911 RepID=A0A7G9YML6_9EURY|nr:hypothetical protein DHJJDJHP_00032 [Methanosarcinales archaeon ANME-2c ERB4]QNO49250.1 hypothetical protein LDNCKMAD_00015 [Methanosarcinales archaeon ANME-2c ERB4]